MYECTECGEEFEKPVVSEDDYKVETCPACGSDDLDEFDPDEYEDYDDGWGDDDTLDPNPEDE